MGPERSRRGTSIARKKRSWDSGSVRYSYNLHNNSPSLPYPPLPPSGITTFLTYRILLQREELSIQTAMLSQSVMASRYAHTPARWRLPTKPQRQRSVLVGYFATEIYTVITPQICTRGGGCPHILSLQWQSRAVRGTECCLLLMLLLYNAAETHSDREQTNARSSVDEASYHERGRV